ncbi:hypothetical protein [Mycobacterium sp. E796]|uniref:hypothetical protein n=1 Tax=Mycobacterium sp. E796 TaxID=1834151 RepID=UPI0018D4258E|nr:hypothetical protein [Mycobacterium sp. E796]
MNHPEDQEDRRLVAYHEAGHAVAAVKCPGGRVDEIDISYNPLVDDEARGYTKHDHEPEDQAFIIYGGPWAHARAWIIGEETRDGDDRTFESKVAEAFRCNHDDWFAYERQMGGDVDAIKAFIDEEVAAFVEGRDRNVEPPPLTAPDPEWHVTLTKAWPEIEELAIKMLDVEKEIVIGDGNRLIWQGPELPNRWRNPDTPSDVDYKSLG